MQVIWLNASPPRFTHGVAKRLGVGFGRMDLTPSEQKVLDAVQHLLSRTNLPQVPIQDILTESGLSETQLNAALSRLRGRSSITIDGGLNWTAHSHVTVCHPEQSN